MIPRSGLSFLAALTLMLGALAGGCTVPPVREISAPADVRPMDTPGQYRAQYVTTSSREGVRQPFIVFHPPHPPAASVILLTGGDGAVQLGPQGIRRAGNFLIRSRFLFADQDLLVAVVDSPSDRPNLNGFRTSQAHALDIKGVIAYLREQAPVPVWLVGTSYGTVSAAKIADWLADGGGPDGVVLTSSLFIAGRFGDSVYDADPARVRVPLLLVHNQSDRCPSTPITHAPRYVQRMAHARPAELIPFQGGGPVKGEFCEAFDFHGFPGLEPQVVDTIARWIKAHPPR